MISTPPAPSSHTLPVCVCVCGCGVCLCELYSNPADMNKFKLESLICFWPYRLIYIYIYIYIHIVGGVLYNTFKADGYEMSATVC